MLDGIVANWWDEAQHRQRENLVIVTRTTYKNAIILRNNNCARYSIFNQYTNLVTKPVVKLYRINVVIRESVLSKYQILLQ